MLTREQKLLFARLVFNAKEILFADLNNSDVPKEDKAAKWFEILTQLNSVGANIPDYKTLRDQEWSNMRRSVERKLQSIKLNEGKAPEEQTQVRPFNQTEDIVLDVLGKGSGNTMKVDIDLSEVQMPVNIQSVVSSGYKIEGEYEEDDDDEDFQDAGPNGEYVRTKVRKVAKRKRPFGMLSGVATPAELNELRRKKLRLEIMKLELEVEKLPLECAKLELEIQQLQKSLQ